MARGLSLGELPTQKTEREVYIVTIATAQKQSQTHSTVRHEVTKILRILYPSYVLNYLNS